MFQIHFYGSSADNELYTVESLTKGSIPRVPSYIIDYCLKATAYPSQSGVRRYH